MVLVVATRGEQGEQPEGLLAPGETLGERRTQETLAAPRILGESRVEFLGYVDSGMMVARSNGERSSFCQANVEEAARRLSAVLVEERAEVLKIYDQIGITGHPDHFQVHRVGLRAAALDGTPRVYEATLHRDQALRLIQAATAMGVTEAAIDVEPARLGTSAELITTTADVRGHLATKRAAMAAHASQFAEVPFFLAIPPEVFEQIWGHEYFIRRDDPPLLERPRSSKALGWARSGTPDRRTRDVTTNLAE